MIEDYEDLESWYLRKYPDVSSEERMGMIEEAYATLRDELFTDLDSNFRGLDHNCFQTHPNQNNILTLTESWSLSVEQQRALGFLDTMSRNEYAEAKELQEEAYAILDVL